MEIGAFLQQEWHWSGVCDQLARDTCQPVQINDRLTGSYAVRM